MNTPSWLTALEQTQPSYLLLSTLAAIILAAAVLHQIGLIGWLLRGLGSMVKRGIKGGFLLWKRLFGWASWPSFLTIAVVFLLVGWVAGPSEPSARIFCGMAMLFMGAIACLAYMFIDFERNEVERGHKVVHNPRKGQLRATYLERHGKQVQIPLLLSATVAVIGGFALFNQGLYETIGRNWYLVADPHRRPDYADFLAYSLSKILGLMDVLDLAKSHHILGSPFIHQASWQASTLLVGFKLFFTPGLAPPDHRLSAARKTAGGDDHRFLEPARTDPRASPRRTSGVRQRGHRSPAQIVAFGRHADQGTTRPTAGDPGKHRSLDHPGPGTSSS